VTSRAGPFIPRLRDGHVAAAFGEEQQGVGGECGVVDDLAFLHHFLELLARHPLVPDAVLLRLGVRLALRQAGCEEVDAVLVAHAVGGT
jgi:hypothetical protein